MSTSAVGSTSGTGSSSTHQLASATSQLNPQDFINMMLTQLENQDPLNPTQSQDLLTQMSQIGQMQSSSQLQTTLTSLTLQNSISSAGNLIGKSVAGLDANGAQITGTVNSVQVKSNNVYLELNTGQEMSLSNVTGISQPAAAGSATPTATTPQ